MPNSYREQLKKTPGIGPILLFVLPLPLVIVVIQSLITGRFSTLLASLISLSLIWIAALFLKKAHQLEWTSRQKRWNRSSRFPWRHSAAIFVAISVFIISLFLLKHNILVAIIGAVLALSGVVLRYGVDPQSDKNKDTVLVGVTTEELIGIIEEAEINLESIESSAKTLNNKELKNRLLEISKNTRVILGMIEEDPKDLRKARKFLKVYLQGAQKVASQYAQIHPKSGSHELEQNFRNVLDTIEQVISEQKTKLLENNILDLDVKIEVLEAQLKHEGVV